VYPEAVVFRINLADIYIENGRDTEAKLHLEQVLAHLQNSVYFQPANEDARAYRLLGAIAARRGEYPQAKQYIEKSLAIDPKSGASYVFLGGVLMESEENYVKAMEYFKKAMELEPVNEAAYDYMGSALFNMGNYEEASRYFQQALRINPTSKEAQQHLKMANEMLIAR
jgi:tetratricopeptide (TPR) repeat protein